MTVTETAAPRAAEQPRVAREMAAPLWRMSGMLGPRRWLILLAIAIGVGYHAMVILAAGTGAWLVAQAATGAPADALRPGLILLAALVVPTAAARLAESHVAHVAGFRTMAHVRGLVYAAFERLAPGYMLNRRSGDVGAVAVADIEKIELLYAHTLGPVAVAAILPIPTCIALAVIHPALVPAYLPALLLLATVPVWLRARAQAEGRALREALGDVGAEVIDTVQGLRETVSFGAQSRRLRLLGGAGRRLRQAKIADARRAGIETAASEVVITVGILGVLLVGGALVAAGSLSPIWYPVAVVIAAAALMPVTEATRFLRKVGEMAAAAERILALLHAPAPVVDLVDTAPEPPIEPRVRFESVGFAYGPGLPPAVREVSFEIAPGETVALVGHSGAGKSTCANLLLRLWDTSVGAVRIGGHDVRDFPQEDLRRLLTLVPQDTFLFNVSLRENIRLGRPGATDAEVADAARGAQAAEFIEGLPDGYETSAGEFGVRMSGGQRQRIAIARALLKDAPILILDEAVSNLDAESETAVAAAMDRARAGRTTLVIAHRLSTIRAADRVVVLEDGRVVEIGTHDELVAAGGAYVRLLAAQLDARITGSEGPS